MQSERYVIRNPPVLTHSCPSYNRSFCLISRQTLIKSAETNNNIHGRNAQLILLSRKKGSAPLSQLFSPVMRPKLCVQKKKRRPDTPRSPFTNFSGCISNCWYSPMHMGIRNTAIIAASSKCQGENKSFHFLRNTQSAPKANNGTNNPIGPLAAIACA